MDQHTLPNDMTVSHLHLGECVFLYEEIFLNRVYRKHGITLDPSGCVFDVGANIGMSSLFFHSESPNIRIYAFEPSPPTYQALAANMSAHGVNCELYNCALSRAPGTATFTFYPQKSSMSGLFADPSEDKETTKCYMVNKGISSEDSDMLLTGSFKPVTYECELRTLSSVIDDEQIDRIDLLKLDVEKAEWDVLLGIRDDHWPKIRQVVVEVHDVDGRVESVKALLEAKGFTTIQIFQDSLLKGSILYDIYAIRETPPVL